MGEKPWCKKDKRTLAWKKGLHNALKRQSHRFFNGHNYLMIIIKLPSHAFLCPSPECGGWRGGGEGGGGRGEGSLGNSEII